MCVFCEIVRGEAPAHIIYHDDTITAFRDLNPQPPVHILLVPNEHIPSARELTSAHSDLIAHLILVATELARQEGIDQRGYRLATNVGWEGGQHVDHLHVHLLGGQRLGAPWG